MSSKLAVGCGWPLLPSGLSPANMKRFLAHSEIEKLCETVGCRFLFLPPYSPALNKIEGYWVFVKTRLRKLIRDRDETSDLMTLTSEVFMATNKTA